MSDLVPVRDLIIEHVKGITPKYVLSSNILVLNQKCIRNNKINFSIAQFHDPKKKFSGKKVVKIGDILINSTGQGTAGRCAFVKSLPKGLIVIVDSHILIIRINDFYTAGCVEYSLFSIEELLQTFMDGSTGQGEFDKQRLFNIYTGLPTEDKRESTFKLLNSIDTKIELNNGINTKLEVMAKTLYDYWFVQFDFPDQDGKPYKSSGGKMVYNEILKREIPMGWEASILKHIATLIRRGISPKYLNEGGCSVLNQKCIRNQVLSFGPSRRHGGKVNEGDERILKLGDVLVNSTGVGTLGRVAVVKRLEENITLTDSHVTVVRNNINEINTEYFGYSLLRLQSEIERAAEGSTGQVELRQSYLEDLNLVVPCNSIQIQFSNFVSPILNKVATHEIEAQQLTSLRDWLLPMLMNGQVTVK